VASAIPYQKPQVVKGYAKGDIIVEATMEKSSVLLRERSQQCKTDKEGVHGPKKLTCKPLHINWDLKK